MYHAHRSGQQGLITLCILAILASTAAAGTPLRTRRLVTGLNRPVGVAMSPNDATHMFIIEKRGAIKVMDLTNNMVNGTLVMDISSTSATPKVVAVSTTSTGDSSERGLLGIAFHPSYDGVNNRFFYVYYINSSGNSVVSRYQMGSGTPYVADVASETILLSVTQPSGQTNHKAGCVQFGPDGKLYVGFGDGGGQYDQHTSPCTTGNGQCLSVYLGKVLRMDVDIASPYVPADNPTIGDASHRLIWAYGCRNPWRFTFDRLNGDFYLGHVGQDTYEWVDYAPAGTGGSRNYGWRCKDGPDCSSLTFPAGQISTCPSTCPPPDWTAPLYYYTHGVGNCIIGGYVYRGSAIPDLQGTYFFADNGSNRTWTLKVVGGAVTGFKERTCELSASGSTAPVNPTSFGQDLAGELYIVGRLTTTTGEILKIEANPNITFTQQPASQAICQGQPVSFTVAISGVSPSSYVWRKDGNTISGAPNSATYTINSVGPADAGAYSVLINNCFLSNDGILTVNTPPPSDINADCARNATDVTLFVQVMLGIDTNPSHVSHSDLDGSGVADGGDIAPFLAAFLAP